MLLRALLVGAEATLLLGAVLVRGQGPGFSQSLLQGLGGVLEDDGVCGFVLCLEEV